MTSKVIVEAQSHPCEVRLMPRVGNNDLWKTLSDETKRFAQFAIPVGETREYSVHSGQSVAVRELSDAAPKIATNDHDELRATAEIHAPGRYLLRGRNFFDKPYEADLIEWSGAGRLRVRHMSGSYSWLEGGDIPFVVESLASGTLTEGGDVERAPGDSLSGPVPKGDAQ